MEIPISAKKVDEKPNRKNSLTGQNKRKKKKKPLKKKVWIDD